MRLLMIFTDSFGYEPAKKSLDDYPDVKQGATFTKALVAFIQAEEKDEENPKSVTNKLLNHIKWAARKNSCRLIVLHSFAHLSESKAKPEFAEEILNKVQQRLEHVDYKVSQTPFGYFLDLNISAPGHPLARLFREF